jgi:hypothetical protein
MQRPVRGIVRHVEQEGLRLVPLLQKLDGEVGDEIGLVAAFRRRIRLPVAIEGGAAHIGKVVAGTGVARTAEETVHVMRDVPGFMPVLRRDHVQPADGAGDVTGAFQHLEHRHAVVREQSRPRRHANLVRVQAGHQRRP